MKNNSQTASKKYSEIFTKSASAIHDLFYINNENIKVKIINKLYLSEWRSSWEYDPKDKCSWNWDDLIIHYSRKGPKYIPVCLWADDLLIGMCILKISKGRRNISILYIEAARKAKFYEKTKGKASSVIVIFAAIIGEMLKCEYISLVDPVNDSIEEHFIKNFKFYKSHRLFGNKKSLYLKLPIQ